MKGKGSSVASAILALMLSNTAAVMTIMTQSAAKSTTLIDRKLHSRSVSLLMRAIRSPVRLPPKNSSDSRCKWA